MPQHVMFPDAEAATDLLTFASRAVHAGDGSVRLRASGGTLGVTCAPLAPRGLFDATPTVLALRFLPVDPELVCDIVVTAAELTAVVEDPTAVRLPDVGLSPAWAGISPPKAGWQQSAPIAASTLASRAQWGIASVAESLPKDAGEDAVRAVRATVWGAQDDALDELPLGVAFAAFTMGFIGGEEEASVRTAGVWTRVTLTRGHVIVRGPARAGLTAVRATGTA
jgi:hypothetical protein